ncbi:hypothetical protein ACFL1F_00250 [Chlamydiota bacterium]
MKEIRWNLLKNERLKKMRNPKLTIKEKEFEKELIEGNYTPLSKNEFQVIADAIRKRKKDAILNLRVNKQDLEKIKRKAKKLGIRYQTFLSEIIHKIAM